MQVIAQWAVECVFYSSIAFVVAVSSFWPWWKSQLGWTIVAKSVALTVAVLPAMLGYWFDGQLPEWLTWVTICALFSIPVILAWRVWVLWQIQRSGGQQV